MAIQNEWGYEPALDRTHNANQPAQATQDRHGPACNVERTLAIPGQIKIGRFENCLLAASSGEVRKCLRGRWICYAKRSPLHLKIDLRP